MLIPAISRKYRITSKLRKQTARPKLCTKSAPRKTKPANTTMMRNNDDPSFEDCLRRFKERSTKCIRNAYEMDHPPRRDPTGALRTTLPSDLFSLLRTEWSVLTDLFVQEGLSPSGGLAKKTIEDVLASVEEIHEHSRMVILTTLDECCAAANDCFRMAENMETFVEDLQDMIELDASNIIRIWTLDAIAAAERTQVFASREVQIHARDYFSPQWEEEWTRNEVSLNVVEIFGDILNHVEQGLANEYLYHKAVGMAVKALTCLYIRCLVNKADSVLRKRRNRIQFFPHDTASPFQSHARALRRLADDIVVFKDFCEERCGGSPALRRLAFDELYILDLIHESLATAEMEFLESFILVLHKRTGADMLVTRYFVGDLWTLMEHQQRKSIVQQLVKGLHPDLEMVTRGMKERARPRSADELVHMDLSHMLKSMYEDRVAQGVLPACYTCLPKIALDGDGDDAILPDHIRMVTRKMEELKWFAKRMAHPGP